LYFDKIKKNKKNKNKKTQTALEMLGFSLFEAKERVKWESVNKEKECEEASQLKRLKKMLHLNQNKNKNATYRFRALTLYAEFYH